MNIQWEISEKSNDLIALLETNGFFERNHFCPKARLRIELELKMQEKWQSGKGYNLTANEFEKTISLIVQEEVSETLYDLIDSDKIRMSVNSNGKIVYSLTDKVDKEFYYDNGVLKVFRNKK